MSDIFRELAIAKAPKQAQLINDFIRVAPFWAEVPMQATSDGFQNKFERIKSIEALKKLDGLDSPLPSINMESTLGTTDLSVFGGSMEVGQDKANVMGGVDAYFAKHLQQILPYSAQQFETGTYNDLRAYAKRLSQEKSAGGTTANKQFSLVVIKWFPGETTGLYNEQGFGNGKVFESFKMNNGNLYNISKVAGEFVPGYGMYVKSNFGLQLEGVKHAASIVNIDLLPDPITIANPFGFKALPSAGMLDDAIYSVEGAPFNTMIVSHPRVRGAFLNYGRSLPSADVNWDGIRWIGTYNVPNGTEAVVV